MVKSLNYTEGWMGSIPAWETKILHAVRFSEKKKKTITKFLKQILKIENFIKDVKEPNESYKTENYHNQNKKSIKYTQE